jgi:hypothetical protein
MPFVSSLIRVCRSEHSWDWNPRGEASDQVYQEGSDICEYAHIFPLPQRRISEMYIDKVQFLRSGLCTISISMVRGPLWNLCRTILTY